MRVVMLALVLACGLFAYNAVTAGVGNAQAAYHAKIEAALGN